MSRRNRFTIPGFVLAFIFLLSFVPGILKKAAAQPLFDTPYRDSAVNFVYNQLFCDDPELFRPKGPLPYAYPFDILYSEASTVDDYQRVIEDTSSDPKLKFMAYRKAIANGKKVFNKDLLGVIVEMGLKNGLEVFASFENGTMRYIDTSGKTTVWNLGSDKKAKDLKNELSAKSQNIVYLTSRWEGPRWPHPTEGMTRITLLASDGFYFGEGPTTEYFNNRIAGPALVTATDLAKYLSKKTARKTKGK